MSIRAYIVEYYNRITVLILGLILIFIGLFYTTDLVELTEGIYNIFVHHHQIDSNLLSVAGNTGSLWVNSGLIMISCWLTYFLGGSKMKGIDIAAAIQIFGFSFYSLSLIAVWPSFFGAQLEAKVNKKAMADNLAVAWFTTAVSPIVSTFIFHFSGFTPGSPLAVITAFTIGFVLGFISSMLAGYMKVLHKGRLLFNMGFTTGIVAWFFYNFVKYIGLEIGPLDEIPVPEYDWRPYFTFMSIALYFIVMGAIYDKGLTKYFNTLFWTSTDGGDYCADYSKGSAWINVGVVSMVALTLVAIVVPHGQLEDGTLAGVFTAGGFAAFGVTLRSWLPMYFTAYITSFTLGGIEGLITQNDFLMGANQKLTSLGSISASMHIAGSSPVVKRDGLLPAVIVTVLHVMNTGNTSVLTGWMHSYNNGFSQGIVLVLFYPVWYYFSKRHGDHDVETIQYK